MKISNLPKTGVSSKKDLLTVVQGGVTKTISKKDLLNSLESKVSSVVAEIKALKNNVSKKTISKDTQTKSAQNRTETTTLSAAARFVSRPEAN